jgi:carbon-monoxide dehydrogenase medium subunit
VKPAPFDYLRAESVEQAVRALRESDGDGKVLAGGQSLVPMMALRIARPTLLVDINRIPGLAGVTMTGGSVQVGTLTRHSSLLKQREHPLLAHAARFIGHPAIRSRGTVGGSVAHADPAAELPLVAVALDAVAEIAGPDSTRTVPVHSLLTGALQTSLADDEMITTIEFPLPVRWGFAQFTRRHGDFGLITVVAAEMSDGMRIAVGGGGGRPCRVPAAEEVLAARPISEGVISDAAGLVVSGIDPAPDLHATAGYRRSLAGELTRRALRQLINGPVWGAHDAG